MLPDVHQVMWPDVYQLKLPEVHQVRLPDVSSLMLTEVFGGSGRVVNPPDFCPVLLKSLAAFTSSVYFLHSGRLFFFFL